MIGGAAGYRPRVRSAYYERVYVHSLRRDRSNIRGDRRYWKGASNSFEEFGQKSFEDFLGGACFLRKISASQAMRRIGSLLQKITIWPRFSTARKPRRSSSSRNRFIPT